MLIGPTILQYAIGRIAPFSRGPFLRIFRPRIASHLRMHLCMLLAFSGEGEGESRNEKKNS